MQELVEPRMYNGIQGNNLVKKGKTQVHVEKLDGIYIYANKSSCGFNIS